MGVLIVAAAVLVAGARTGVRAPLMVGYSDFTAFNLAYLARGGVSFAGPCAIEFGAPEPSAFTID